MRNVVPLSQPETPCNVRRLRVPDLFVLLFFFPSSCDRDVAVETPDKAVPGAMAAHKTGGQSARKKVQV